MYLRSYLWSPGRAFCSQLKGAQEAAASRAVIYTHSGCHNTCLLLLLLLLLLWLLLLLSSH